MAGDPDTIIYLAQKSEGWSCGPIICVAHGASGVLKRHEYGHSRQSLALGPLYLPVVMLPSFTLNRLAWALPTSVFDRRYYDFYTERWADAWGGVSPHNREAHRHE
ncbi:hypothetical protein FACS1894186_0040 [Alphaproteobacteria bacterium]|nr:hypothetical protein FACS1894186_0040 [Alphaproteobacteria bacterium]